MKDLISFKAGDHKVAVVNRCLMLRVGPNCWNLESMTLSADPGDLLRHRISSLWMKA